MTLKKRDAAQAATWLTCSLLFVACGGGGDASSPPGAPDATVTITGVAADGPLQGATACYDLDDDGAIDPSEPCSEPTGADGRFAIVVPAAEAGRHRVVVRVPRDAVDRDTGAQVGSAFTLVAPATGSATQPVFASPLTTLVQTHMDVTGTGLAEAEAYIQARAGLAVSPLADFTASATPETAKAAHVARLIVLASQKQADAVAAIVDTRDLSGTPITAGDVRRSVDEVIVGVLPSIGAAASDPAIAAAPRNALGSALAAAADAIVAGAGVSAPDLATQIGLARLPADTTPLAATATASLTAFRYGDADNWLTRTLESSAADNTPDAAGKVRYYSVFRQSESSAFSPSGVVRAWASGNTRDRAGDLHWSGAAWVACALGDRNATTPRDAEGRGAYEFCNQREAGVSRRVAVNLQGKAIATVFRDTIRTFPGGANGVEFAHWGPADLAAFGAATFPEGATLYYQTNTVTAAAPAYDVLPGNRVTAYSTAVAAGGDARSGAPACSVAANQVVTPVHTLEDLVARHPGRPCRFNRSSNGDGTSLDPNDWWNNSTASIGVVGGLNALPAGTGNYYTPEGALRVAFAASGNGVTYYNCLRRRSDGSLRNCEVIGTGAYAVQTLGDARVMTFSQPPALHQRLSYVRVFVERGGQVYFGYAGRLASSHALRLNLPAMNAVFATLGMPLVRPVTRPSDFSSPTAAALATAQGAWGEATPTEAVVLRVGEGGRFLLGQAGPADTAAREQTGGELGWLDLDPSTGAYASLLEVDSDLAGGTSHHAAADTVTVSPSQIATASGERFPRLVGGTTGIVGLWAVGSATDLSVVHLAFFANGRMMLIDSRGHAGGGACALARQGPPGAEFASYTFDPASGALRIFDKRHDTNGCGGFFDSSTGAIASGTANSEVRATLAFAADGRTAAFTEPGEPPLTIHRIASQ